MKKTLLIIATLAFISFSNAQNIGIPDANFKAYLVGNSLINLNGDSEIQTWEAAPFNGVINASNLGITDLTGIAAFTSLTSLNCSNNSLTTLNLTYNTALTVLYCQNNSLTSLNLTQNTALSAFRCFDNSLTSLDLSANTSLTSVLAYNNQLTSLNVANGNNSNILGGYFNTTNNPNLICITVDDVAYSTANWTNIDAITNFSTNCGCIVSIPDSNFKNYLVNNPAINTSGDSEIQCYEANLFTGTINVNNSSITNLTGIEAFTSLTELYCANNSLTSIDISQNIVLTDFSCNFNQITNLDVSQNTLLTLLACRGNQLTSIDVSNNTLLQYFSCRDNLLTNLDVSNNPDLVRLWCFNNLLTSLDIKNGANTNITNANFNATNNPNLTCIEVDDAIYSTNNWTNIDTAARFSIDCSATVTFVPDDNFEQVLVYLGYDDILDNYVFTANINTVTIINLANQNISDLTGIEDFTALETLYLANNLLNTLDVSSNIQLTNLHFYNNQITSIDLSANVNLSELTTIQNPLTTLDLSLNTALTKVNCINSSLTSLNIKNGANTNIANNDFKITNNPNLTCIEVDDASWSATNWTNIDATSSFSSDCGASLQTYIVDTNFEAYLEANAMGNGIANDNYVTTANINSVTILDVSNQGIANLTGIEDFIALTSLRCNDNQLTSLDLSQNTALTQLRCQNNSLASIDISTNLALTYLRCYGNALTSLDVSNNTALTYLRCDTNSLTSLDVSNNTALTSLRCYDNSLTSLDVSNNTSLTYLRCQNNQLTSLNVANAPINSLRCYNNSITSLDMSTNTDLTSLHCYDNSLISLNMRNGNNTNVTDFFTTNNPNLTCIEVDDASWSTTNWTNIDTQVSYSEDCNSTSSVNEITMEKQYDIYPNPAKDNFKIESDIPISKILIYDNLGKLMLQFNAQEAYDVSSLTDGIYFIQIKSNTKTAQQKLIISSF